jgi:erythronate-4-phosphate dehydrogenase
MLLDALTDYLQLDPPPDAAERDRLPPLALEAYLAGAGLIRHLIATRYDIGLDDALFRQSLEEPDPAAAFDRLRREYRVRRELAGSTVTAGRFSAEQRAVVLGLGCAPRPGGPRP